MSNQNWLFDKNDLYFHFQNAILYLVKDIIHKHQRFVTETVNSDSYKIM